MTLPSWRYHRTLAPRIIQTAEEHDALEAQGWAETPAAFLEDKRDDDATEDAAESPSSEDAAASPSSDAAKPKRRR